ncbi:hypothetical protein XA68_13939 [Ophiocordyceps unilateralis]|uniref:Uncharacterized protein n=1 Tax=Ophiocordyceps unilateralis TaxID=268505 RepID=A0A2A9PLI4_OPHUN|nr:hypothetical protein XA68_13939 [Ophiocordyceps unilateralis]
MRYAIPLITAVVKVAQAKRHLNGGIEQLDPMQLAEMQTLRPITSVARARTNEIMRTAHTLTRQRLAICDMVEAREHAIKARLFDASSPFGQCRQR